MIKKAHVVGAGIAGLTTAYFLRQRGFDVTLHEASPRVGGLIGTTHTRYGIAESAAPAFMNTAFLEQLCEELNVDMLCSKPVARRNRFLENAGKVSRWPLNFLETLRFLLGLVLFKIFPPKPRQSVSAWATKVFGSAVSQKIMAKVLQGIYGADIRRLSAPLIFNRFYKTTRRIAKPKRTGSVTPRHGMQEFIDQMLAGFVGRGGRVQLNCEVESEQILQWSDAQELVLLATPVWVTSKLLNGIDPAAADAFGLVPSVALESNTIFWERGRTVSLRPGFGILFDRSAEADLPGEVLGVLQNDQIFEQRVWSDAVISETWISSGCSAEDAVSLILKKRATLVQEGGGGLLDNVRSAWSRAIPIFGVELELALSKGHSTRVNSRGIYLVGNYMGQIGVSKIVERSNELAEQLATKWMTGE